MSRQRWCRQVVDSEDVRPMDESGELGQGWADGLHASLACWWCGGASDHGRAQDQGTVTAAGCHQRRRHP